MVVLAPRWKAARVSPSRPSERPLSRLLPRVSSERTHRARGQHLLVPIPVERLKVRCRVVRTTTCCSAGTFDCPHKMNTIPHSRATRYFFYNDVTSSVTETLSRHQGKRMAVNFLIPETNPANDVFRVGTLLELLRTLAGGIVADGKRCKICVQGSMGKGTFQGLPLQLSGLRKLLDLMDWEPEVAPFVSFGAVKEEDVEDQDVYIVVCPQNIVGASIIPDLKSFAERAEERGAQVSAPSLSPSPISDLADPVDSLFSLAGHPDESQPRGYPIKRRAHASERSRGKNELCGRFRGNLSLQALVQVEPGFPLRPSHPPVLPLCPAHKYSHSLSLSLTLSHCLSYDSQEAVFSPDIWVLAVRWAGEGLRGVQEGGEERHRDGGKGGEVLLHEVIRQSAWPSPNHRLHLHVRVLLISLGNHCKTRQDKTNQTLR